MCLPLQNLGPENRKARGGATRSDTAVSFEAKAAADESV
jgi:hypothetical protein